MATTNRLSSNSVLFVTGTNADLGNITWRGPDATVDASQISAASAQLNANVGVGGMAGGVIAYLTTLKTFDR